MALRRLLRVGLYALFPVSVVCTVEAQPVVPSGFVDVVLDVSGYFE